MKIIQLKSENVKKIKAIDITPKDDVVIISGKNGAGKSSVLDSIWFALQGRTGLKGTPMPIRKGEKKASVVLTLDDIIVTRTWTADDKSRLKVTNREGLRHDSPQDLLDSFIGELTFDPLEFAEMKEKDQRDLLLKVAKIDIDSFNEKIERLREERRLQGQKVKLYEGEREEVIIENLPEEEISVSGLNDEFAKALNHNQTIFDSKEKIERLEDGVSEKENEIESLEDKIKGIRGVIENKLIEIAHEKKFLRENVLIDVSKTETKIKEAVNINNQIGVRNRNIQADHKRNMAQKTYDDYTTKINTELQSKVAALKNAKMPIKSLSIDDNGVTYNGIPFSQLSSSEKLRISMAMGMALNSELKVILVTNATLLDESSMKVVKAMAKAHGYQIWCEVVDGSGTVGFYIEEGEVKNEG